MATILVADDDFMIINFLEEILRKQGHTVHSTTNGEHALELARAIMPDLVLCDLMIPGISGEEVRKALQNDDRTGDIQVVLMSAAYGREDKEKPNLLSKPFTVDQLNAVVQRVLDRSGASGY